MARVLVSASFALAVEACQRWGRAIVQYCIRCPPIGKLPVCTISLGLLTSCELHFFIDAP
jgi:hypothetical protein